MKKGLQYTLYEVVREWGNIEFNKQLAHNDGESVNHSALCSTDGMNYSLNIPRYPQRFEPHQWPSGKLQQGEGPEYWGNRACGLACLRMIIAHFGNHVPPQYELLTHALEQHAYSSPQGWIHKGLAKLGKKYGLSATPILIENSEKLQYVLETIGPVIASITHKFPEDGRKGGHLVVISGCHRESETISFRDPSRWGENHSSVSEKRFFSSFTGRGICFSFHSKKIYELLP
ncbi:Peptidase C39 family protein [Marininema mesophilum]|uniref:Peptidase C39 family protein n=1 Tax=Marininema mesophilum TaxID=1048340 RepID=A0A1H2T279_9BACL|nr:C39 family peptidase [Marininema mesophilum]SDW37942.1 Peptidase C39 family protein [Marininema mesophilum]